MSESKLAQRRIIRKRRLARLAEQRARDAEQRRLAWQAICERDPVNQPTRAEYDAYLSFRARRGEYLKARAVASRYQLTDGQFVRAMVLASRADKGQALVAVRAYCEENALTNAQAKAKKDKPREDH